MSRAQQKALAVALLAAVLLGGCGATQGPDAGRGDPEPAATPGARVIALTPELAAAVGALEQRLRDGRLTLSQSAVDYRPGEPTELQHVPRAVYRVDLADPNAGWVLIYDLSSPDAALQAGRTFAAYLSSGVGQTNYPRDAQFALNQSGGVLIFSWWSRERTSDANAAQAAVEAVRRVGQPIEVVR